MVRARRFRQRPRTCHPTCADVLQRGDTWWTPTGGCTRTPANPVPVVTPPTSGERGGYLVATADPTRCTRANRTTWRPPRGVAQPRCASATPSPGRCRPGPTRGSVTWSRLAHGGAGRQGTFPPTRCGPPSSIATPTPEKGVDTAFARGSNWFHVFKGDPDTNRTPTHPPPPFYAVRNGGPGRLRGQQVNDRSQVLTEQGRVIPRTCMPWAWRLMAPFGGGYTGYRRLHRTALGFGYARHRHRRAGTKRLSSGSTVGLNTDPDGHGHAAYTKGTGHDRPRRSIRWEARFPDQKRTEWADRLRALPDTIDVLRSACSPSVTTSCTPRSPGTRPGRRRRHHRRPTRLPEHYPEHQAVVRICRTAHRAARHGRLRGVTRRAVRTRKRTSCSSPVPSPARRRCCCREPESRRSTPAGRWCGSTRWPCAAPTCTSGTGHFPPTRCVQGHEYSGVVDEMGPTQAWAAPGTR